MFFFSLNRGFCFVFYRTSYIWKQLSYSWLCICIFFCRKWRSKIEIVEIFCSWFWLALYYKYILWYHRYTRRIKNHGIVCDCTIIISKLFVFFFNGVFCFALKGGVVFSFVFLYSIVLSWFFYIFVTNFVTYVPVTVHGY